MPHQPQGEIDLWDGCCCGQCPCHQLLADPHAKAAGDKLVEYEAFRGAESLPSLQHALVAGFVIGLCKPPQHHDPICQIGRGAGALRPILHRCQCGDGGIAWRGWRWLHHVRRRGQDQGDRFCEIADNGIGFLHQPEGQPCALCGPVAQLRGGDSPAGAAARQKGNRPDAVR